MTDRRVKEYLIKNTNKPNIYKLVKKEQTMTREEALGVIRINIPNLYDEDFGYSLCDKVKEAVTALEQPITLSEILGWEEGQEYEWRGDIFRIQSDILQVYDKEDEMWFDSSEELNDYLRLRQAKKVENSLAKYLLSEAGWKDGDIYDFRDWYYKIENGVLFYKVSENDDWKKSDELYRRRYLFRAEAKKVKPKPKAYHVKDEYSFNCLIKELVEKGYTKSLGGYLTIKTSYYTSVKETTRNYIYLHDNDRLSFSHELVKDGYDIIEYHKEEPKYFLQSNLKGDRGTQYFSFDRNKNRKFFASELFGDDKYTQIFTKEEAKELQKENAYAALCELVEVE